MEKRADKRAREIAEANLIKEIKRCVSDGNYDKALDIISEIDIPRLKGTSNLILIGEVYMQEKMFDDAASVFMKAYNKAPNNRRILNLLTSLYIEKGDYSEAEYYYKEFIAVASRDVHRYILRYRLDKAKGERSAVLIDTLEHLKDYEYMEEWAYELAQLYHKSGDDEKAVRECDEIQLWFGHGPYVNQALRLKSEITGEEIPIIEDYEAAYDDSDDETADMHTGFTDATIDINLIEKMLMEQENMKKSVSDTASEEEAVEAEEAAAEAEEAVETEEAAVEAEEAVDSEAVEAEEAVAPEAVEAEPEEAVASEVVEEDVEETAESEPVEEDTEEDDDDDFGEAVAGDADLDEDDFGETEDDSVKTENSDLFDALTPEKKTLDFWSKHKKRTRRFFKKRSVDEIARDQMVAEASKVAGIDDTGPIPEEDFLSRLRREADQEFDDILAESASAETEPETESEAVSEPAETDPILEGEAEAAALFAEELVDSEDDDDEDDDDDETISESDLDDLFSEEDFAEDEDEIITDDMLEKDMDIFGASDFEDDEDEQDEEASESESIPEEAVEETVEAEADEEEAVEETVEAEADAEEAVEETVDAAPAEEIAEAMPEIKIPDDTEAVSEKTVELEPISDEMIEEALKKEEWIETSLEDDDDEDFEEERIWTDEDKTFIEGLFSESKTSNDLLATMPNIDYVKEQLSKTFTRFDDSETDKFDLLAEYDINFVVLARDHSVKSQIALGIAKALNTYGICEKSKIVRASAADLNGRDFSIVFEKLKGGCLIVDDADALDDRSAMIIEDYVSKDVQQTAIVFSSTNEKILGFWKKHQNLRSKFLNVINVSKYNEMELVNLARGYIEQRHYELDPESALILRDYFKRCLDADEVVNYEDVMSIVDVAITHLENRNVKNLFMTVLDNKYEEAKMFKLLPMDFAMLK